MADATGRQLRQAIEKVHHKNFTIWYDAGNILFYSDGKVNPVEDVAAVDGLVTGWCIKDYRHPRQVDINPGSGQVDFPAILARLKQGGFAGGPLLIETLTPGTLPQLLAEAKKAHQFIEALVSSRPAARSAHQDGRLTMIDGKLGVAIHGVGQVAYAHATSWLKNPRARIVRVSSRCKESAQRLVAKLGLECNVGDDFGDILRDERVDIVNISGPNQVHAEQGIAAAEAGKHLLMEKPMCVSMSETL